MKTVTVQNCSRQGFEIILKSTGAYKHKWLSPKERVVVPFNSLTDTLLELKRRRLVEIY